MNEEYRKKIEKIKQELLSLKNNTRKSPWKISVNTYAQTLV